MCFIYQLTQLLAFHPRPFPPDRVPEDVLVFLREHLKSYFVLYSFILAIVYI